MTVTNELIDSLLAHGTSKPEDLIGENGLLKLLTKKLVEPGPASGRDGRTPGPRQE